jgi:hypothetical protein
VKTDDEKEKDKKGKRRRKMRRGLRKNRQRKEKRKDGQVCLKILLSNIRGVLSKKESLENILEEKQVDVCLLNETNLRGKRKINLKNYSSFIKNHPVKQSMGGLATLVADHLRQSAVKVSEYSEGDEFLVVRLDHLNPALNIINIYGQQEGRDGQEGRDQVLESWTKVKRELCQIESRGEAALLIGDMNRALGSDELGVPGTKPGVSYGGKLVRQLLEEDGYFLLNGLDLAEGGPWTRVDPATGGLSCLDLAIGSANLLPYVRRLEVDSGRKFTPKRVVYKDGKYGFTYTDHFALEVELLMPSSKVEQQKKQVSRWNLHKPGAWEEYEWRTNLQAGRISELVEDENIEITEVVGKVNKELDKIKYKCFGKTKVKVDKKEKAKKDKTGTDEEEAEAMAAEQSEKVEKQISRITSSKLGRCGNVFKMKEVITGPKKSNQEAQAVKDPKTGRLVVEPEEIKKVTLEYCLETLKNNEPAEELKEAVAVKEELLSLIMENKEGSFLMTEEDYWAVVAKFEKKNKRGYDFLTKSGEMFKGCVGKLCRRILKDEIIPSGYYETLLVQLFKGKGSTQELGNSRFLHLKDWAPRLCEALTVEGMKDAILANSTKFQIGGQPGMRTQFHLFVLKSIIGAKKGIIITFTDIVKFFDKESLTDACLSLHGIVDQSALRLWWLLNRSCSIAIQTGTGMSERGEAGGVLGQGSAGAGLVSQLLLDQGVDSYFKGSRDELQYGEVRIQPLIYLDDLGRVAENVMDTRAGNIKLASLMEELCLQIHPDKSCYVVCGTKKFKQQVLEETEEEPIMFGKVELKKKAEVTYLGDVVSEDGLSACADATISAREGKVKAAILELKSVCEDYRMDVVGGMLAAIDLFNVCIVSSLLSNSGTWIGIKLKSIERLDALQNMFVCQLLHLPPSTPRVALRAICGLLGMKWRIWEEKICLVKAIREQEEGSLAREVLTEQLEMGWPGLASEATEICKEIGLKNVCTESVEKKEIKEAIFYHHYAVMKQEMTDMVKLNDLKNLDLRKPQQYLGTMCLLQARTAARLQLYMLRCPGNMPGLFRGRMECEACVPWRRAGEEPPVLTQSHYLTCPAYRFLQEEHLRRDPGGHCFSQPSANLVNFYVDISWIKA